MKKYDIVIEAVMNANRDEVIEAIRKAGLKAGKFANFANGEWLVIEDRSVEVGAGRTLIELVGPVMDEDGVDDFAKVADLIYRMGGTVIRYMPQTFEESENEQGDVHPAVDCEEQVDNINRQFYREDLTGAEATFGTIMRGIFVARRAMAVCGATISTGDWATLSNAVAKGTDEFNADEDKNSGSVKVPISVPGHSIHVDWYFMANSVYVNAVAVAN